MAEKINFTKAALNALTLPAGSDRMEVYDTKVTGLQFVIRGESREFYLYRWVPAAGRARRLHIGSWPDLSVENARTKAEQWNGDIANGKDPAQEKRKVKGESTFGALFDYYLTNHAKPHKRTWKEDEDKYNLHLIGWKNRKITTIKAPDVKALHTKIGKTSPGAANRVLALASKVFNTARDWDIQHNPVKGIARFNETSRERKLEDDELPRFRVALESEPSPDMKDFFKLLILTGARRGNVMAARWDEFNLDASVWTVPAHTAKGKREIKMHLVPQAVAILRRRLDEQDPPSEWVFPSHSECGHMREPKKAFTALLKRAKIKNFRLHDLRRSIASTAAKTGASLQVIGKQLGHRNPSTTAIYSRLDRSDVAGHFDTAANVILPHEPLTTTIFDDNDDTPQGSD